MVSREPNLGCDIIYKLIAYMKMNWNNLRKEFFSELFGSIFCVNNLEIITFLKHYIPWWIINCFPARRLVTIHVKTLLSDMVNCISWEWQYGKLLNSKNRTLEYIKKNQCTSVFIYMNLQSYTIGLPENLVIFVTQVL